MKSRLTRTAIAAAAVLAALAVSAGPASAAVPPSAVSAGNQANVATASDECASIRQEIAMAQSLRSLAQAELPHATPSQRADLVREIRSLTALIRELSAQLEGCPA